MFIADAASHTFSVAYGFRCSCGWEAPLRSDMLLIDQGKIAEAEHKAHVAEVTA